ncbi:MAG: xseB [Spirochaetes bacterium]|nr:MAG: xseB [Spirochaetota bacterium]
MKNFEQRLVRLETLAEKIKDRELPIEEAIHIFEEGIKLSRELKKELQEIEARVEVLLSDETHEGTMETALVGDQEKTQD